MRRHRYKRRKTEFHKQERSFHRWLAIFMAVVLLMSESNLTVLAEEVTSDEGLSEEAEKADEDNTDDTGITGNIGDAGDVDDTVDMGSTDGADDTGSTDNPDNRGNMDNADSTDSEDSINDRDGLSDEDNADENNCVCENRCSEDMVYENCPVCAEDYANCIGQEELDEPEKPVKDAGGKKTAYSAYEWIETYAAGSIMFWDEQKVIYYHVITDT